MIISSMSNLFVMTEPNYFAPLEFERSLFTDSSWPRQGGVYSYLGDPNADTMSFLVHHSIILLLHWYVMAFLDSCIGQAPRMCSFV
jgi:hypothetical protein